MKFCEIASEDILSLLRKPNTLVLCSVNFEERSLKWLSTLPKGPHQARFKILMLKSTNVGLLEWNRDSHVLETEKKLKELDIAFQRIRVEYPKGFDRELMKRSVLSMCKEVGTTSELNIVFEITGLPRIVIFCILQAIYELQRSEKLPVKLYVVYTAALIYPFAYPHEVGTLVAYHLNAPLHEFVQRDSHIRLLVVPSIYGFEARSLIEGLSELNARAVESHLLVPLYKHDILTSINVLKINPELISLMRSAYGSQLHFAFSPTDAMQRLLDISNWQTCDAICLIAPFNIKPLAVSAFYACLRLSERGIPADIIRMSAVQYSSMYSIGSGKTFFWAVKC